MTALTEARPTTQHTWLPYVTAAAGFALLLKAVLIIGSSDDVPAAATTTLYLGGILLAVTAAVGAGLRQRRGRRTAVAVGLVLALLAYVMVLSDAVGIPFAALSDAPWVADEGPVGVLGAILLLLAARSRS